MDVIHLLGGGAGTLSAGPDEIGAKAAGLARMAEAGLPVPPGFVLPTSLCRACLAGAIPQLPSLLDDGLRHLERVTGLAFGADRRPLLVSVRSGAPVSMPGMMDTILNVGLNDRTVRGLIRATGNPRHAWDSYRRLIQAYAETVCGLSREPFDAAVRDRVGRQSVPSDTELDAGSLAGLARAFLDIFAQRRGEPFPQDPRAQLAGAAAAVFRSWTSPRASAFRRIARIDDALGTAVTVQAMVFGNMGGLSGSGVAFTRDPGTGENELYVDFAWNGQGEDVVSGRAALQDGSHLRRGMPALYEEVRRTARRLEEVFRDAQDFEFTIQGGRLYLLQSRDAKRTPWAALRIVHDLSREGLIDGATARGRLRAIDVASIERTRLVPVGGAAPLCRGTPASPGVAIGPIVFHPEAAVAAAAAGRPAILARAEISTADVAGLAAAAGVVTTRGGRTSHAAVVARQFGRACVVGCRELVLSSREARAGDRAVREGDRVSLDGSTGDVYAGAMEVVRERPTEYVSWARELEVARG